MSRIPRARALKGSQRWLQEFVGRGDSRLDAPLLDATASSGIEWLSPIECDDFAEYQDGDFLRRLGLSPSALNLEGFWPRLGPVWDGLAVTDKGVVVLLEAKAHAGEMSSRWKATSPQSIDLITRSLEGTAVAFGSGLTPAWTEAYYQYANRLAHLRFLRDLSGVPTALVFVYFTGDDDMDGPGSAEEWEGHLESVRVALGLPVDLSGVVDVFVDIR
jgi:hypothetical protein